jgi:protein-tyrosine-phosphatase
MNTAKPSILFVCMGNTCRSVMAEAFAKQRFGSGVHVESAGLRHQTPEDAENAVYTLKTHFGLDASAHVPRDVRHLDLAAFTTVVALDKSIARQLTTLTDRPVIVWDVNDPFGDDLEEYRQCAFTVKRLVRSLEIPGATASSA